MRQHTEPFLKNNLTRKLIQNMSYCDIVIVNWNAGEFLKNCISSILSSKKSELVQTIYVVDNASNDSSTDTITDLEKVMIIRNSDNKGFGVACNQGIALTTAPYVIMINPDVVVFENTLSESVAFMETRKDIDILGVMQVDELHRIKASCSRFPTPFLFLNDAIGLSKLLPNIFKPATLMTEWNHSESREVDQIIGAYMFIRRSVFDRIGVFDPLFFVYYEELDLSKRLKDAGGVSFYNHKIQLLHYGEGTTKNVKGYRLYLNLKSRLLYAKKHFGRIGFFITLFSTLLIEPITRTLFSIFQGRLKDVKSIVAGFRYLLKDLKIILLAKSSL